MHAEPLCKSTYRAAERSQRGHTLEQRGERASHCSTDVWPAHIHMVTNSLFLSFWVCSVKKKKKRNFKRKMKNYEFKMPASLLWVYQTPSLDKKCRK